MNARWISIPTAVLLIVCAELALTAKAPATETQADKAKSAEEQAAEARVKKSGCFECHGVAEKIVGPAFRDIAARYKDKAGARDALIKTVKKGGKGNWTEITGGAPMPPHSPRLTDPEIERLVDWVLSR